VVRVKKYLPIAADVLLVILFCAVGRRSHDESVVTGLLHTVWPFAIGLALGWLLVVVLERRRPDHAPFDGTRVWPNGVVLWACTLIGGMLLRAIAGQGTAFSFVLVAGTVLAVFLLGWRAGVRAIS